MSRLLHFAFEAALVSTVLSGASRVTKTEFNTSKIENDTLKTVVKSYLYCGDYIFDSVLNQFNKNPDYFRTK
ncbi:hypothetical protein HDU92_005762 [Lobulomyces angularis]|nr:hypothetical protein HDU92_005762 [Lobulomyces angularis]